MELRPQESVGSTPEEHYLILCLFFTIALQAEQL